MNRITITTGTGFDSRGQALTVADQAQALATVRADLAETFGGYTEAETFGGWINSAGELVTEAGRRFVVLDGHATSAKPGDRRHPIETAERIRAAFRQESVVLETEDVRATFVTATPPEVATLAG